MEALHSLDLPRSQQSEDLINGKPAVSRYFLELDGQRNQHYWHVPVTDAQEFLQSKRIETYWTTGIATVCGSEH